MSRAIHISYTLVDAPGAHNVEDALDELGFVTWNTVSIQPLQTIEEAMRDLAG